MSEITMPRLSDSMEEGTIVKWLFADGDHVRRGDELVEIETDKATIMHAADATGTLEIVAGEGTTLPVGAPIARLLAGTVEGDGPDAGRPPVEVSTPAANGAVPNGEVAHTVERGALPARDAALAPGVLATPLARRAAATHAVVLERVRGTGPRGRVTRGDVLSHAGIEQPRAPAAPSPSGPAGEPPARERGPQRIEASRAQQLIARRMAESKATIPHFQVQTDVVMEAALALREGLKAAATDEPVPSINDFVVKACALALRGHPRANARYVDGAFELHARINIGVAVAGEDALLVPVLTDAERRSLGGIARETRRLAERARSGEITPPELSGATFTVSNLGMYGMTAITPVINVSQAAILGVGALRETLARVNGEIVDRTLMTLTLSCDHRILYGADAAGFLREVRALLEQPLGLAL